MLEAQADFPHHINNGDKYGPAMQISDQAEADAYFERCVKHQMKRGKCSRDRAERIERQNLGYYAGYYDEETRRRVERLFHCAHPFFGPIEKNGGPDPQTALNIGHAIATGYLAGRDSEK